MVNIVIIEKSGNAITKNISSLKLDDLYKKCNFRKSEGFELIHTFKVKQSFICIYGRSKGKANQENKFEYPPPIDNSLFFGNMAIVKSSEKHITDNTIVDYEKEQWDKDYEKLMGGFEDIGSNSDDDYESDELEDYPKEKLTKQGYLKDDFIVDDNSNNSNGDDVYSDSEEEYIDSELSEEEYDTEEDDE